MPDREKIIGLLSEIAEYFRECRSNASFASKAENHFWELQNAAGEAAALLKEQEPKLVKIDGQLTTVKYGHCPTCGEGLNQEVYPHWCGFCGQAVKWE